MKSRLFKVSAFSIVTIGALLIGSVAAAAAASSQTFSVSGTVLDPCSGQDWAFTGQIHLVEAFTTDSSGGIHLDLQDNFLEIKLTNLTTGQQGVGSETDHFIVNVPAPANEATINGEATLITAGPSDNLNLFYLMHLTFNANGTMTAFVDNFTIRCSG
jgi:hypothetical protein